MKKLKVSTKPNKKQEREEKIIDILKYNKEGIYPKIIAGLLRENVNTVKSTIKGMELRGLIKKDINKRGIYYLVENKAYDIFDFKFQNAIMICKLPEIKNDFIIHNGFKGIVKYRIEFCKNTSQATLRLSSPTCIDIGAISIFIQLFKLEIEKNVGYTPLLEEIIIRSIEFNKDYTNLRLDGFNSLTVESFTAQYKIYQKSRSVREEYKTKLPITATVLLELLNSGHNYASLSLKTDYLREEVIETKKLLSKILIYLRNKDANSNR